MVAASGFEEATKKGVPSVEIEGKRKRDRRCRHSKPGEILSAEVKAGAQRDDGFNAAWWCDESAVVSKEQLVGRASNSKNEGELQYENFLEKKSKHMWCRYY